MIERYSRPEMSSLWTPDAVLARWVRIESLVAQVQAERSVIPAAAAAAIASVPAPSVAAVREAELIRDHEVLSFLAAWTSAMPDDVARWVHHGLTSYDLVDTGLGLAMRDSVDLVLVTTRALRDLLGQRALEHWDVMMIGRTHGVHAEPISFGHKLAVHAFALDRSVARLRTARDTVAVGTVSGAVGTYSTVAPEVEADVLGRLGLTPEPAPTQVVARDRHAELIMVLGLLGANIEHLALELRLLQRTEVGEVEEPRSSAYQGSSAMPHKRNPTTSERLNGLARLLRANIGSALEDVALWHERDLAHSSVERVILPDSFVLSHFQVTSAIELIRGLRVEPDRMRRNLEMSRGRIFSSRVYGQLIGDGMEREQAYRLVQNAAYRTLSTDTSLIEELKQEGVVLDPKTFDPQGFLVRESAIRDRLTARAAGWASESLS